MKVAGFIKRTGLAMLIYLGAAGTVAAGEDLKRMEPPGFIAQAVREVEIVKDGETVLEIAYEPRENRESYAFWTMEVPYDSAVILDTERMYSFFSMLAELDFSEEVTAGAASEEHGEPENSIRIAYFDGQEEGRSGQAVPDSELKLDIWKQNGGYMGCLEGFEERTLKLDSRIMETVLAVQPYELILKITHLVSIDAVSKMQASDGKKTLVLEKSDEEFFMDGETVDEDTFKRTYMDFMSVLISGEIPQDYAAENERTPLLSLTYIYEDEQEQETVQYFPYDKESCVVNVNGNEYFLVPRADVENLAAQIQDM